MVDVTLLEVHLPEAQFNTPFAGPTDGDDEGEEPVAESSHEGGDGDGSAIGVLLVVIGLAALAWYLRRRGDGTDSPLD